MLPDKFCTHLSVNGIIQIQSWWWDTIFGFDRILYTDSLFQPIMFDRFSRFWMAFWLFCESDLGTVSVTLVALWTVRSTSAWVNDSIATFSMWCPPHHVLCINVSHVIDGFVNLYGHCLFAVILRPNQVAGWYIWKFILNGPNYMDHTILIIWYGHWNTI